MKSFNVIVVNGVAHILFDESKTTICGKTFDEYIDKGNMPVNKIDTIDDLCPICGMLPWLKRR